MLNVPQGCGILAFRFALSGDPEEMVITVGFDESDGIITSGQEFADDAYDVWLSAVPAAVMNVNYAFRGVTVRWNESGGPGSPLTPYEKVAPVQGTENAAPLPNNCAFLVRKLSTRAGRRGKGRMYVPPFHGEEGAIDATGLMTGPVFAALTARYNGLFTALAGLTTPVLLHQSPEGGPFDPPTVITSFAMEQRIATRRLRMRK